MVFQSAAVDKMIATDENEKPSGEQGTGSTQLVRQTAVRANRFIDAVMEDENSD